MVHTVCISIKEFCPHKILIPSILKVPYTFLVDYLEEKNTYLK